MSIGRYKAFLLYIPEAGETAVFDVTTSTITEWSEDGSSRPIGVFANEQRMPQIELADPPAAARGMNDIVIRGKTLHEN